MTAIVPGGIEAQAMLESARQAYLDLLARAVCNYLYIGADTPETVFPNRDDQFSDVAWTIPEEARPHTIAKFVQIENLRRIGEEVIRRGVPGDFLEAGIWAGGLVIYMAGLLRAYGETDRALWAADSFAGIPKSRDGQDAVDQWVERWEAGLARVQSNIRRYDLLTPQIRFIQGYFADTLPGCAVERLALLRVDADTFDSTMDVLNALYHKVSPGGFVIIDDWHLAGCRQAVIAFRDRHGITEPVRGIFVPGDDEPMEAFWQVSGGARSDG